MSRTQSYNATSDGIQMDVFEPTDASGRADIDYEQTTPTPEETAAAEVPPQEVSDAVRNVSKTRAVLVIIILSGVSFLNTMGSGILTVALPYIARDLDLPQNLLFWPASVYALAAGCTLLIFGSVADVVGPKVIWQTGSGLFAAFTLACGLCRTGTQLIIFRTLLGVCIAMCLPCAISLTTRTFEPGTRRNICFACTGMGQPLGYSMGLILGGVFSDTIGWRYGYYISAIINLILFCVALKGMPGEGRVESQAGQSRMKFRDIDWIGAAILSASMASMSYVLAMITSSYKHIQEAYIIVLLVVSVALIPTFVVWVSWQERREKPAIIPNSLWRKESFTTTCVIVFFTWAVFNAFQYVSTLWFQEVHKLSGLQTSLRFLPMIVTGAATNLFTGYVVDKIAVRHLILFSAVLTSIAPLLMAIVPQDWSYWRSAFAPMLLSPLHPDVLFTVSNIIISKAYPGQKQALAGGVFNAISQMGNSVGLAIVAALSASISTHNSESGDSGQGEARAGSVLLEGYQAAYWLMFGSMILVCFISIWGLRKEGKVGKKDD